MAEKRYSWIMSLTLVSTLFMHACTTVRVTEKLTHITLKEWLALDLFTPVILYPPPGETKLQMGPFLAETSNYVELYYTEDFTPHKVPPGYQIYQSDRPLPIGKMILSKYASNRNTVITKEILLPLLRKEHSVEIRRNNNYPNDGVAIFTLEGTYVAYYWQNVAENVALKVLTNSLILVHPNDAEIIASFDSKDEK